MLLVLVFLIHLQFVRSDEILRRVVSAAIREIRDSNWRSLIDPYMEGVLNMTDDCDITYPSDEEIEEIPLIWRVGMEPYGMYVQGTHPENYTGFDIDVLNEIMIRVNLHYGSNYEYSVVKTGVPEDFTEGWFDYLLWIFEEDEIDFHDCTQITAFRAESIDYSCAYTTEANGLLRGAGVEKNTADEINDHSSTVIVPNGYGAEGDALTVLTRVQYFEEMNPTLCSLDCMVNEIREGNYQFLVYGITVLLGLNLTDVCPGCTILSLPILYPDHGYEMNVGWSFPQVCPSDCVLCSSATVCTKCDDGYVVVDDGECSKSDSVAVFLALNVLLLWLFFG